MRRATSPLGVAFASPSPYRPCRARESSVRPRCLRVCAVLAGVTVFCACGAARAADADRARTGEFFFVVQYALGDEQTTSFGSDGESATIEYDDGFKLGPGFGYNFSDHV